MTEMVKISGGDSTALFLAAQRFSKEAVQQSTNWSPETLWQAMEDRFHRALRLWRGEGSEKTPRFFSKLFAEQKMDLCLNTALILEYYTQQRKKKCTIYCKVFFFFFLFFFFFFSYSGVPCEESAGFVYRERPLLYFHSWKRQGGGGKGEPCA